MEKQVVSKEDFKIAIQPLEELKGRQLTAYEIKSIYYILFDSPKNNDFKFVIQKYAQEFYFYHSITPLEIGLIIDVFKHFGLTHRDLDKAFKIRTQQVLAKARVFPTPAELIVLIKPDAILNIYDNDDRQNNLYSKSTEDIKKEENEIMFKRVFRKMNV